MDPSGIASTTLINPEGSGGGGGGGGGCFIAASRGCPGGAFIRVLLSLAAVLCAARTVRAAPAAPKR